MTEPMDAADEKDTAGPVRFQVILSAGTVRQIDRIKERLEVSSRADVLRSAVRMLDLGLADGNEIWIRDKDGKEYRILVS